VAQAVEADLDRAVGDAEAAGDRLLGQVLFVAQLDQFAIALAEALERRMQVGPLDRGEDLLVLGALPVLGRVDRVGSHPRVVTEGLVADDRAQPLLAPGAVAKG
jgi:hypothetical protein